MYYRLEWFKIAKVSNIFVDIIMGMYADYHVSNLIKDLNVDEKEFYE